MPKSCSFKVASIKQKLFGKLEPPRRNQWHVTITRTCIVFTIFALLLSALGQASAVSFPPMPSKHIVVDETCIFVSLSSPLSTILINVAEYDSWQILKNVTVEFCEPVTFVGFTWKVLSKRPSYLDGLGSLSDLQYYSITFSTDNTNEVANVKMDFEIEKDTEQKKDAEEETLLLYRYNGEKMEECAVEKVNEENDYFLYFRTETEGSSSYVVVTRGRESPSWWFAVVIIVAVALVTLIGIYCYKKFKLSNLRKTSGIVHGE